MEVIAWAELFGGLSEELIKKTSCLPESRSITLSLQFLCPVANILVFCRLSIVSVLSVVHKHILNYDHVILYYRYFNGYM